MPLSLMANLLDLVGQPILVSDRTGRILLANVRGKQRLKSYGVRFDANLNLFSDLLRVQSKVIVDQIESGDRQVDLELDCCSGRALARIQWFPDTDWLVVRIEGKEERKTVDQAAATQHTVQELLQEREITYRNLLAAYLRLQEVNRQKTVFLASAPHELKTPLAVI